MARVSRMAALALWIGLVATAPGPVFADAEGRAPQPEDAVRQVLGLLASPLQGTRAQGALELGALLRGTRRAEVLGLLDTAPDPVVHEMIPVFAVDAKPDAIEALARHLVVGTDEQATRIALALARQPAVVSYLQPLLKDDPAFLQEFTKDAKRILGKVGKARLRTLAHLLFRAHIERLLVERKSKWGGTGYYQGQYEKIASFGHHELAMDVVTGVALDEAMPIPGVFTGGFYEFLYPHDVDIWELRGMAINAVGELAKRTDTTVIARIDARFNALLRRIRAKRDDLMEQGRYDYNLTRSKPFQDKVFTLGRVAAETADFLLCLYLIRDDEYRQSLDDFISDLKHGWQQPVVPQHVDGMVPGILIRARRYAEAVAAYRSELYDSFSSRSFIYYNMACAYASWSRDPGDESAADLRHEALKSLRRSFRNGWRDLGWMEEDRDLDPIRDSDIYREIVRDIKVDLDLR